MILLVTYDLEAVRRIRTANRAYDSAGETLAKLPNQERPG